MTHDEFFDQSYTEDAAKILFPEILARHGLLSFNQKEKVIDLALRLEARFQAEALNEHLDGLARSIASLEITIQKK